MYLRDFEIGEVPRIDITILIVFNCKVGKTV